MTLYRQDIIERYRFPRHKGVLKDADAQGEAMNSFCGDDLTLYLKWDADRRRLVSAVFSGQGCALMHASAEILCDAITGMSTDELLSFRADDLLKRYGEPPTPGRLKCVLLPYEALKRGLRGMLNV